LPAERVGGGDGGIDRIAALFENLQPDLGSQRLAGDDHAVPRHHFRTPLGCPAFGAVTANRLAKGALVDSLQVDIGGVQSRN
jgi:hypothetical protein